MKIIISPRAEKEFKKLSKVAQIVVAKKIRSLSTSRIRSEKLQRYKNIERVRVGDFRIVYKKIKSEIYTVSIGHRKDVYDKLKNY